MLCSLAVYSLFTAQQGSQRQGLMRKHCRPGSIEFDEEAPPQSLADPIPKRPTDVHCVNSKLNKTITMSTLDGPECTLLRPHCSILQVAVQRLAKQPTSVHGDCHCLLQGRHGALLLHGAWQQQAMITATAASNRSSDARSRGGGDGTAASATTAVAATAAASVSASATAAAAAAAAVIATDTVAAGVQHALSVSAMTYNAAVVHILCKIPSDTRVSPT